MEVYILFTANKREYSFKLMKYLKKDPFFYIFRHNLARSFSLERSLRENVYQRLTSKILNLANELNHYTSTYSYILLMIINTEKCISRKSNYAVYGFAQSINLTNFLFYYNLG